MRKLYWISLLLFSFVVTAHAFTLSTDAFTSDGVIPATYTCDGNNISPALSWKNPPANTQTFALILSDTDAPNGVFYHWVVFNIPKNVLALPQGMTSPPTGAIMGKNTWNMKKYKGPCPPKNVSHHYIFTIYALDTKLNLADNADATEVLEATKKHTLASSTFRGTYQH